MLQITAGSVYRMRSMVRTRASFWHLTWDAATDASGRSIVKHKIVADLGAGPDERPLYSLPQRLRLASQRGLINDKAVPCDVHAIGHNLQMTQARHDISQEPATPQRLASI